ncbi:hypothetical protein BU14_1327s0001 [Porphyra umbilicalis]|uniref:Uncharacterized protein n=1 Tax=Porphyra umbilicalis TaxID=2786 RepID=A0A1X6NMD7_PORUM|nr:hypothetical protein BU14_1327s0001 [Porphyra umbilicalis]|eukprot:OSX69636.1 hypothetical protein BU14_1327s0001 [Porphyra umbilicalis]
MGGFRSSWKAAFSGRRRGRLTALAAATDGGTASTPSFCRQRPGGASMAVGGGGLGRHRDGGDNLCGGGRRRHCRRISHHRAAYASPTVGRRARRLIALPSLLPSRRAAGGGPGTLWVGRATDAAVTTAVVAAWVTAIGATSRAGCSPPHPRGRHVWIRAPGAVLISVTAEVEQRPVALSARLQSASAGAFAGMRRPPSALCLFLLSALQPAG